MRSLLQAKNDLTGDSIDGYNLLENEVDSCDPCNKTYKTKNSYDRQLRKAHSTSRATGISDHMIT